MSAGEYFLRNNLYPKNCAKANAASLPDGSIRPYNSLSTETISPVYKNAHVPLISDATSDISTLVFARLRFHYLHKVITT